MTEEKETPRDRLREAMNNDPVLREKVSGLIDTLKNGPDKAKDEPSE